MDYSVILDKDILSVDVAIVLTIDSVELFICKGSISIRIMNGVSGVLPITPSVKGVVMVEGFSIPNSCGDIPSIEFA